MTETRDHGGGLDAAVAAYGGQRSGWLDLSTGINPVPYPVGEISAEAWTALPDRNAQDRLLRAARAFWNVPEEAQIVAAPGASALIAQMPALWPHMQVYIPGPTYNEHAAAFAAANVPMTDNPGPATTSVFVHPNNPDGADRRTAISGTKALVSIVDESFCDTCPEWSLTPELAGRNTIILKSFGKFWGLAGLRLGFAIGLPHALSPVARFRLSDGSHRSERTASLTDLLGPWAVAGPALELGARALEDIAWAEATRARLTADAARLDALMTENGASVVGGTTLFRLYDVGDAAAWQDRLARGHVWSRIFPYSDRWLRLGLPAPDRWEQLEATLG